MKRTATFEQINVALAKCSPQIADECNIDPLGDDSGTYTLGEHGPVFTAKDDLAYYLGAASEKFSAWLKERDLFIENDTLTFNLDTYPQIAQMCLAIQREYDYNAQSGPLWKEFDLSGDDDVDYNGGYLIIAMDIICVIEKELANA